MDKVFLGPTFLGPDIDLLEKKAEIFINLTQIQALWLLGFVAKSQKSYQHFRDSIFFFSEDHLVLLPSHVGRDLWYQRGSPPLTSAAPAPASSLRRMLARR